MRARVIPARGSSPQQPASRQRTRGAGRTVLATPRWIAVHLGVLVLVAAFLGLGWWQFTRAAAGNLLSYGYAIEWPVFAAFVIWVWAVEMRKALRGPRPEPGVGSAPTAPADQASPAPRRRVRNEAAYDDSDDPALAAYNHYLAWLAAHPHLTPADYPGLPDATPATKENT